MKLIVERTPLKRVLLWFQWVLFVLSVPTLGYCLFAGLEAWMFQKRASLEMERRAEAQRTIPDARTPHPPLPAERPAALSPDAMIGRIEVPRLGLSAMIAEGIAKGTLGHAVGHIPLTGMPGQAGANVGLAGHRDTFFRPLKGIRTDDVIVLTTADGVYRYHVVSTRVVAPTEVSVLEPVGTEILTLVTCFPFAFVGPAPGRFIVRAERTL